MKALKTGCPLNTGKTSLVCVRLLHSYRYTLTSLSQQIPPPPPPKKKKKTVFVGDEVIGTLKQ